MSVSLKSSKSKSGISADDTLTPLYDIVSAYPILAKRANRLARQKTQMAMAVSGKNSHYKWLEIQQRHWLTTTASVGL